MGKSGASYTICIIILDTIFHWKLPRIRFFSSSYNIGIKVRHWWLKSNSKTSICITNLLKRAKNIWLISIEIYLQYNIGIKCFLVLWYYFLLCTYTHIIKCISPPHPYNINTDISSVIKHGLIRAFYYACLYLIYVFIIHQYLVSWAAI